jgi:hypothetical protein
MDLSWMYSDPQRSQRFTVPNYGGGPRGISQLLSDDAALLQMAARRRQEEQAAQMQEHQEQLRRAATGSAIGGTLGGIAGAATGFIPVAGPAIATAAVPTLALAGSKIGEKVAGGTPKMTAMDALPVAEGLVRAGNVHQMQQQRRPDLQKRIDAEAAEMAFLQSLDPSMLQAYAHAPSSIVGQVRGGDYGEFHDRFVPYWERRA